MSQTHEYIQLRTITVIMGEMVGPKSRMVDRNQFKQFISTIKMFKICHSLELDPGGRRGMADEGRSEGQSIFDPQTDSTH